jgi:putative ABC transport system ATP-binding protein
MMMRVEARSVDFAYGDEGFRLRIPELKIEAGERVAMVGPSGCGKTTLLRLLAGIVQPQAGTVRVGDFELSGLDDDQLRAFRIRHIGFIFQDFRLIDYLDVRENIRLPWRLNAALELTGEVDARLHELATALQLDGQLDAPIDELSQGEQQRTAIGRALLPRPGLILADEPTGNLDPANKTRILDLLFEQAAENESSLVMVTHDHGLLERFDRVIDFAQFHPSEAAHA